MHLFNTGLHVVLENLQEHGRCVSRCFQSYLEIPSPCSAEAQLCLRVSSQGSLQRLSCVKGSCFSRVRVEGQSSGIPAHSLCGCDSPSGHQKGFGTEKADIYL